MLEGGTNWTNVYCQLAELHLSDPLFHAENFGKVPVALIYDLLENHHKTLKMQVNANSISTAKLGTVVISALGGKQAKAKLDDFLPYPREDKEDTLSEKTKDAVKWALKTQHLPPQVVALLGSELA